MTRYVDFLDAYWIQAAGKSPDGGYAMEADALAADRADAQPGGKSRKDQMSELKEQIDKHEYKIDSERVAEEMIKRLRLAQWARAALVNDGAGSPGRPAAAG